MPSLFAPISRLFRRPDRRDALVPLYNAIVAEARNPYWYQTGGVTDTVTGRFNMLISLMVLVLLRLEAISDEDQVSVALTEIFVDDMDSQMREDGVGDVVVGKKMGKMISALGGRLSVFRDALMMTGDERDDTIDTILSRNLYDETGPHEAARHHVRTRLIDRYEALTDYDAKRLLTGDIWTQT